MHAQSFSIFKIHARRYIYTYKRTQIKTDNLVDNIS